MKPITEEPDSADASKRFGEDEAVWYVDGLGNAINNLEMLDHFLELKPPWCWKWAVIAAHQALYTFFILALAKTSPIRNVTVPERAGYAQMLSSKGYSIAEIAQKLNTPEKPVAKKKVKKLLKAQLDLISIWEAKDRLCADEPNTGTPYNPEGNDYLPWAHSRRLKLSDEEKEAFEMLVNGFRNEFEYFRPKSWIIYTSGFPEMFTHILRIIQFVALESNCITYYKEEEKEQVEQLIARIRSKLAKRQD